MTNIFLSIPIEVPVTQDYVVFQRNGQVFTLSNLAHDTKTREINNICVRMLPLMSINPCLGVDDVPGIQIGIPSQGTKYDDITPYMNVAITCGMTHIAIPQSIQVPQDQTIVTELAFNDLLVARYDGGVVCVRKQILQTLELLGIYRSLSEAVKVGGCRSIKLVNELSQIC